MKKILCVDNQKDLIDVLASNNKQAIIVDCLLIDNLGMVLLQSTIHYYNKNNHIILLSVNNSLPYLIFAIENDFKFIFTKLKNTNIDNYKELAKKHKCRIFNFTENIFKC